MTRAALLLIATLLGTQVPSPAPAQVEVTAQHEMMRPPKPQEVRVAADADGATVLNVMPASDVAETWRFWIRAEGLNAPLALRDLATGQGRGEIPPDALVRGAWSPPVTAGGLRLVLPDGAMPDIRLLAWTTTRLSTQTPVGVLNLDRIADRRLPIEWRRLIDAVGHLSVIPAPESVVVSGDFIAYCTAFLIERNRAMTAGHCVDGLARGGHGEIVLGYVTEDAPDGRGRYVVALEHLDRQRDLAILTLDRPVGDGATFALAGAEPSPGTPLTILQHFAGEPMTVSDDADCMPTGELFDGKPSIHGGRLVQLEEIAFGHGCDTTKSSSGAPVIDRSTLAVVGMHQRGYGTDAAPQNLALRLAHLMAARDGGESGESGLRHATGAAPSSERGEAPVPPDPTTSQRGDEK